VTSRAVQSSASVAVFSFSPTTGNVAQTVTIYGTGFSTSASQDTVKFNGTPATVSFATTTQLVATVPPGASSGTISVSAPGQEPRSPLRGTTSRRLLPATRLW
jgi:hypothetical protein